MSTCINDTPQPNESTSANEPNEIWSIRVRSSEKEKNEILPSATNYYYASVERFYLHLFPIASLDPLRTG